MVDRALAVAVEHGVDIYGRAAPLWRPLHAAAVSDPEVDAYVQAMAASHRAGMGGLVARLDPLGYLREVALLDAARAARWGDGHRSRRTSGALVRDSRLVSCGKKVPPSPVVES